MVHIKRHSIVIIAVLVFMSALSVFAQDAAEAVVENVLIEETAHGANIVDDIVALATGVNTIWMLIAGFLVFLMQAGFAMLEAGFIRAKNTTNVLMKNTLDFALGSIAFLFVGYAFMYGDGNPFIGMSKFFLIGVDNSSPDMIPEYAQWFFQVVFAATAATIVSGAMAERTKFVGYIVFSIVISAVIYPISGHWVWGGGWLDNLGFHDYAGSSIVHAVGGFAALAGAIVLGPRIGKFNKDGKPNAIPGHNMPLAALGVFLLWFGWFGFNPGSSLGVFGIENGTLDTWVGEISTVVVNTNIAAAVAAVMAMVTIWIISGKPDFSMTMNGALAGLVAITAGCGVVNPLSAIIIGFVAGILVVLGVLFIERVLKVDDPVGAIAAHGINGIWGTLAVGLFALPDNGYSGAGLFFGGGWHQLGIQALGTFTISAWAFATMFVMFLILKYTIGLRTPRNEELRGLDVGEHGNEAYAGFQIFSNQ